MIVLYSSQHVAHAPKHEFYDGKKSPYAEKPDRIENIVKACKSLGLNIQEHSHTVETTLLNTVHEGPYASYLQSKCAEIDNNEEIIASNFIKDTYTPLTKMTYQASLHSANLAAEGAKILLDGSEETVYALCRPPGHHAEKNAMSGYCYINNAAVASQILSAHGTVAILDIDYHHGNGTQNIFYDRNDVLYVSIHAEPQSAFPYFSGFESEIGRGEGEGYNHNIPLSLDVSTEQYLDALQKALKVITRFNPDYFVLSLGFDTYKHDPIAGLNLEEDAFRKIGTALRSSTSKPMLVVQEGGYNVEKLGSLAKSFLTGLSSSSVNHD